MPAAPRPPIAGFVAGFFLLFFGFIVAPLAALALCGSLPNTDPAANRPVNLLAVAGGVVMFVAGTQVLARSERGGALFLPPELMVLALMTPIPAVLAVGFGALGKHLRTADAGLVRAVLAGGGIYLLVMAGLWLDAGYTRPGLKADPRSAGWAVALEFGLAAVLMAVTPGGPRAADPVPLELAEVA
jgi:hypothetical protein